VLVSRTGVQKINKPTGVSFIMNYKKTSKLLLVNEAKLKDFCTIIPKKI
jgi:hypothetical protein